MANIPSEKEIADLSETYRYKGLTVCRVVLESSLDAMETFEVREDDIFIVTFPKSGTHWMSEIVGLILNDGDPFKMDRTTTKGIFEMIHFQKDSLDRKTHQPFMKIIEEAPSPRIILTHLPFRFLPPQIGEKKAKIIYVARNPKDVLLSFFNFAPEASQLVNPDFNKYCQDFIEEDDFEYGSWFDHTQTFWKKRDEENILFLKYEDMKLDPHQAVRQVAEHLNRPLSDELLNTIVEKSTFDGMKKSYDKLEKSREDGVNITKAAGAWSFMKKGKIGNWKSRFTVALNEWFDEEYKKKMAGTDLSFRFE